MKNSLQKILREFKKSNELFKSTDNNVSTIDAFYNNNYFYLDLNNGIPALIEIKYKTNISIDKASRSGWITNAKGGVIIMVNLNRNKEEKINHSKPFLSYNGTLEGNTFKSIKVYNFDGSIVYDKPKNNSKDTIIMKNDHEILSTSETTFDYEDAEFRVLKFKENRSQYDLSFTKKTPYEEGLIGKDLFTSGHLLKYKKNNKEYIGTYNIYKDNKGKIVFTANHKGTKLIPLYKDINKIIAEKNITGYKG